VLRAAVCNCNHAKPDPATPHPTVAKPSLVYSPKRAAERACALSAAVCSFNHAKPCLTMPSRTELCLTITTLQREQQRKPRPPVLPSATVTAPCLAAPHLALPCLTGPCRTLLGLTPKAAQLDQATSASMRLRVAVTGSTSASKRPCLGRQSPSPTSLPASLAISSTSRKFNTSGSY